MFRLCVLFLDKQGDKNGEGVTTTSNLNNLPGKIRIRAGVAVNLRQDIGIQVRYLHLHLYLS